MGDALLMNEPSTGPFRRRLRVREIAGAAAYVAFLVAVLIGIVGLVVLLAQVLIDGLPWVSKNLLFNYPSRHTEEAGLRAAIFGTLWLMGLTAAFTVPIGIGAAIYLEEYAAKNKLTLLIEVNISNLAGVPSIVYGLLGLALFVQWMALGRSVLAGALTMSLLTLPIVIIACREAIRAVPATYREAAYALGATQWDVVRGVIVPAAFPGMLTGIILGMSRAVGETAPIIAISALVYLTFVPQSPMDRFTVLPIQIYNWVSRPQEDFRGLAAGGIVVLLVILLSMNALAIYLRNKYQIRSEE
jgi:phosphate transport system permease protein